jgi:hypothetical protein
MAVHNTCSNSFLYVLNTAHWERSPFGVHKSDGLCPECGRGRFANLK